MPDVATLALVGGDVASADGRPAVGELAALVDDRGELHLARLDAPRFDGILLGLDNRIDERLHLGLELVAEARPEGPITRRSSSDGSSSETAREPKDIAPNLAGEVARVPGGHPARSPFSRCPYAGSGPTPGMNHRRAAILKAFLIRNRHQEVPVALKSIPTRRTSRPPLRRPRVRPDEAVLGDINRSVKDAYFGAAAAATPSTIFPRLMRLNHHHLKAARADMSLRSGTEDSH